MALPDGLAPAACTFHPAPRMENTPDLEAREHDLTMHVFTVSAGMLGVCLTAIGLLRLIATQSKV